MTDRLGEIKGALRDGKEVRLWEIQWLINQVEWYRTILRWIETQPENLEQAKAMAANNHNA